MRDWCLVIDAVTPEDARRIGDALRDRELDLEVEDGEARVLCFAESEPALRRVAEEIRQTLVAASLWEGVVRSGHAWEWSDRQQRYVDPERPDEELDGYPSAEEPGDPEFHIDRAANRYIAENGGRVYIWAQAVGGSFSMIKTSLEEPPVQTTFIRYDPEGIQVYVEEGIPPDLWRLSHHRFPRRHIRADNDAAQRGARSGIQGGGG